MKSLLVLGRWLDKRNRREYFTVDCGIVICAFSLHFMSKLIIIWEIDWLLKIIVSYWGAVGFLAPPQPPARCMKEVKGQKSRETGQEDYSDQGVAACVLHRGPHANPNNQSKRKNDKKTNPSVFMLVLQLANVVSCYCLLDFLDGFHCFFSAQLGVNIFLALIVGAIFYGVKDDQSGIQNRWESCWNTPCSQYVLINPDEFDVHRGTQLPEDNEVSSTGSV